MGPELRISRADPLLRAMLDDRIGHLRSDPQSELADHIRRVLRTRLSGDKYSRTVWRFYWQCIGARCSDACAAQARAFAS
jgi:hypothetical protein